MSLYGEYVTFKHVRSRQCYQLTIEIDESQFSNACEILGHPTSHASKYVEVSLVKDEPKAEEAPSTKMKSMVTKISIACKDVAFQRMLNVNTEEDAIKKVRQLCGIKSRAEIATNENAYKDALKILIDYGNWLRGEM